jgi:hypothetical protein
MYSVSWRRFKNFSCRYVTDGTDTNNLFSATGNENNESRRQYPHYHTDRTRVTGYETGGQKRSMLCKNIIPQIRFNVDFCCVFVVTEI